MSEQYIPDGEDQEGYVEWLDKKAEIARLREERRSISTLHQKVESLEAENKKLREERRWIPVGEKLPTDDTWMDVAGPWGETIAWHTPSDWRNQEEFDIDVTHWRKRTPGPEGEG